jgi:hypothetical protein
MMNKKQKIYSHLSYGTQTEYNKITHYKPTKFNADQILRHFL